MATNTFGQDITKTGGSVIPSVTTATSTGAPLPGWDAITYANFKAANPGLEPNAQDTALMNAAGTSNSPIDLSAISGGATPFGLPPAPASSSFDIASLPPITSLLNPTPTATETQQVDLQSKLLADAKAIGGKEAATITAEDTAARNLGAKTGLADFTGQLRDITGQVTQLTADAAAARNKSEDRFAPTFAIQGEQAQIERQRSVRALGLYAIAQTLQGNIATAQDYAKRAVELQFAPIQAEIDYLNKALELNSANLTREDKKRADQLQVQLGERQRLLDQQKDDKNTILSWAAEAAKNGASTLTINQAMQLSDPMQALQVLGSFLSDPVAKQQAIEQLAATRAQTGAIQANTAATYAGIEKTKADTAKTKAETAQTTSSKSQLLNLVGQYRELVKNTNILSATFNPTVRAQLGTLRGQITAVYKQQQQLGTLDAGVQKLIDTIFPSPGSFSITSLSPTAQVSAIDNFVKNQGGASTPAQTYTVNGKTYVKGTDGLYYPQ